MNGKGFAKKNWKNGQKCRKIRWKNGQIIPIEVKSGKDYQRHNALSNVLANKNYRIQQAYVFSNDNVSQDERVLYMPIYMVAFLEKEIPMDMVYRVDLAGL